jgi:hypothetical protein
MKTGNFDPSAPPYTIAQSTLERLSYPTSADVLRTGHYVEVTFNVCLGERIQGPR